MNNIKDTKKFIKRNNEHIIYIMAGVALILFITSAIYTMMHLYMQIDNNDTVTTMSESVVTFSLGPLHENIVTATPAPAPEKDSKETEKNVATPANAEENIFTYLQGPKSWEQRLDWSGAWGKSFYDGGSFGGFGCGLCCLANVYSTASQYQCTPVDMYRFARKKTGYGGGGAVAWDYMDTALGKLGFNTELRRKPKSYKSFKKQVAEAECSIVLISSNNSRCYWKDTPGHYVTIFLYDEESGTVFLADSGNPDHNRQRIELGKIYKSLKTESEWQYLNIGSYNRASDIWKHRKLNGRWVKPGYIQ